MPEVDSGNLLVSEDEAFHLEVCAILPAVRICEGQWRRRGEGWLHPIGRRAIPFDTVYIDHVGPFVQRVKGNACVLVLIGGFTKFVLARALRSLRSSEAVVRLRKIFSEYGYPRRIISDRGLAFTSRVFKDFVTDKGVKHVLNTVATPRANGRVERSNRTIIV